MLIESMNLYRSVYIRFFSFQEVTVTEKGEEKKIYKKVEEDRELMGVARVGELAKGLLLTGTAFHTVNQCCGCSGFVINWPPRSRSVNSELRIRIQFQIPIPEKILIKCKKKLIFCNFQSFTTGTYIFDNFFFFIGHKNVLSSGRINNNWPPISGSGSVPNSGLRIRGSGTEINIHGSTAMLPSSLLLEESKGTGTSVGRGVPRGDAQDARASPSPPCASPLPAMCIPPPSPA
jgi:hypothetical protein